jgi:MATE family multidrug resistance protein
MRDELRLMLRLAIPVIVAEIGWISMGIVDTIFVGPLGPAAIGAVGTGSTMFFTVMVLGMGTLFALDTFVAQSYGAGRIDECHRWLFAGLQLAVALSVALVALGLVGDALLGDAGIHPSVIVLLQPYLATLMWSVPPLLAFTVFRRYLQSMNAVRPIMIVLIAANLINALGNWIFIYGHLGMPALGVQGSAYATLAARVFLAVALFLVIVWRERTNPSGLHDVPFAIDRARMWSLTRLGLPAALQVMLEVGVFAAVGVLAARITPIALAANQIALNIAAFVFMVPLGLSSAAAVRVGQAVGRRDPAGVRRAGWVALGISLAVALTMSTVFVVRPLPFLRIFTEDATVLATGASLLFFCALFQPFDGFQAVCTGALRGLADTRTPVVVNVIGHWLIGLPVGCVLCFRLDWGVTGLWAGLALGLTLVGLTLLGVWSRRAAAIVRA